MSKKAEKVKGLISPTPRRVALVVDCSGSMDNDVAMQQVKLALSGLRERDYFSVVCFSGHVWKFREKPEPATIVARERANEFVKKYMCLGESRGFVRAMKDTDEIWRGSDRCNHLCPTIVIITDEMPLGSNGSPLGEAVVQPPPPPPPALAPNTALVGVHAFKQFGPTREPAVSVAVNLSIKSLSVVAAKALVHRLQSAIAWLETNADNKEF